MKIKRSGFTLIELVVTMLIATIVFLGVAVVLADGARGYKQMFDRIHGDIVNDAYVARIKFDRICRKARAGSAVIDVSSAPSLKVSYYSVPNLSTDADLEPDMFAEFYLNGTNLTLDLGSFSGGVATTQVIAGSVKQLEFHSDHTRSVQMVLTLENVNVSNSHSLTVTSCAIMHN